MGFFDFLDDNPRYQGRQLSINRLNKRYQFLVEPFAEEIKGARVLDLASHDGRWSYALAAAGAQEVLGIEAREDQISQFVAYPDESIKAKIRFIQGDVFEQLPSLAASDERFDVVAVFGLYYHIMSHYLLLAMCNALRPSLIIIDSEFSLDEDAIIRLTQEPTGSHLNSIAYTPTQQIAAVGVPSRSAIELMARTLGYTIEWSDWETVPKLRRGGLKSYYRTAPSWKRRYTCALRPDNDSS